MKISIIGAGNVGSALAERILTHKLADCVLVDVAENIAKAKELDLTDSAPIMGYQTSVIGTNNYEKIKNSEAVVITAGFPRTPGMSRDDLVKKNGTILKAVMGGVKRFAPGCVIIVVTNPLDVMTYLAYRESGFEKGKVLGMAGNLDTARFKAILAEELGVSPDRIEATVLGSHGDTMVPIISRVSVDGKKLSNIADETRIKAVVERTKKRGGEIVGLLKSGSAYFSPSAACFEILKAILTNEKRMIPCSSILTGEYGIKDCAVGVPARIGKEGVLEVLEWDLTGEEFELLKRSAAAVKTAMDGSKF